MMAGLLLGTTSMAVGCNPIAPIYFATILLGRDPRIPARFKFPEPAKGAPNLRIAVITDADTRMQVELGHIDREVNDAVSLQLFQGLLNEKQKGVEVIKASKVHAWQDEHPDWQSIASEAEIGRRLKADYLVLLELEKLHFYEEGSNKTLFRGQAEISISVCKVDENDGEMVLQKDYITVEFPKGRPIPASNEMSLPKFRRMFVARIAERVCWTFLPHDQSEEFVPDPF
jgi:hypothetical protein